MSEPNDLNQWVSTGGTPMKCPECGGRQKLMTRDDGMWSCGECCAEWHEDD